MRVLLTGARGQLGTELCQVFDDGVTELIATDRDEMDLTNRDSVVGTICTNEPDVIVHAGAFTAVDLCESEVDTAIAINCLGTRHVVDGARRIGARVLYVSTDYVFDGTLERAYDEWDAPNPQSVYGRTKLGGERELRGEDTIVRTSWVFGRYGANMVRTILKLIESHDTLSFVNDQHGKPTCAKDLATKIRELVVGQLPGLFHVTNDQATTWFEFARTVVAAAGHDPERVHPITTSQLNPQRPAKRPANSVLDNAALRLGGIELLGDHKVAVENVVRELLNQ